MKTIRLDLFVATLALAFVFKAQAAPADPLSQMHLRLNPALKMSEVRTPPPSKFSASYQNANVEMQLQLIKFGSAQVAERVSRVKYLNIRNLFQPRRTPYRGQITQTTACQKGYGPRDFKFKLGSQTVDAVLGGATDRRRIGACARGEIGFWAAYFNLVQNGKVLSARVLMKLEHPKLAQIHSASDKLKDIISQLLLPESGT